MSTDITTTKKTNIKSSIALKHARDKDAELVRGRFRNLELSGGTVKFAFRGHKGDAIENYDLLDGQIYKLPLSVAKHLNNNCWYPAHAYKEDETGKLIQRQTRKIHRFSFESLEFTDIPELNQTDITEVESNPHPRIAAVR